MFTHDFKSVMKNLKKSFRVTSFNLVGLSVSFAAVILLSIYLYSEFSYDRYHENHNEIYQLYLTVEAGGETRENINLPNQMAEVVMEGIPEFVNHCTFARGLNTFAKESDQLNSYQISSRGVDSSFLDMFTLKIKSGVSHPLRGKNKIIISESTAKNIFGNEDPIGKILLANFKDPYTIDAVFYDLPKNGTFTNDAFYSFPTYEWVNSWSEYSFYQFFQTVSGADMDKISEKMLEIPVLKDLVAEYPDFEITFDFMPLKNIHFHGLMGTGNLTFVWTLVMVAILLLFMAFVNYINFAIANAPKLVKTFNMRRVVGESKAHLMFLSILESFILMSASFLIALMICLLTIQFWPDIFGYEILLSHHWQLLILLYLMIILLGVLVTIYPSRMIVGVKPALALKGLISFSAKSGRSGKILTVIQYSISIILISGVLMIEKQISHVKNYDLGFSKENILVLITSPGIRENEKSFAEELLKNPNITDYAYSEFVPGGVGMSWGREIDGKQVTFYAWPVDERYMNFMGLEVVEGRAFSSNMEADENKFIFNQKALEKFGWKEGYLGKQIVGLGSEGELIGVVKDIKYASLHEQVEPLAFWLTKTRHTKLSIKVRGENVSQTIDYIKEVYSDFEQKHPISYSFLDESLDDQYKSEEKQAQLIFIFCLISIIISIVGAMGLIIFMCEYRVKEIGVRKVNGASITEIVSMLNWSFLKWVIIAFVIATPISYYAIQRWMENFVYKTEMSWWIFAIAGVIALLISLLSVSWHSWRAARRNPVEALRYE